MSEWGESVTCATAQTIPRYGFFANGVAVILLLGGGTVSLVKTYVSDRELCEAIEMWKSDRAETAELDARMAMIRKREDYAAAAAAAADAAVSVGRVMKKRIDDEMSPPTSAGSQSPRPSPGHDTAETNVRVMENIELGSTLVGDVEKGEGMLGGGGAKAAAVESPPEGWDERSTPSGEK